MTLCVNCPNNLRRPSKCQQLALLFTYDTFHSVTLSEAPTLLDLNRDISAFVSDKCIIEGNSGLMTLTSQHTENNASSRSGTWHHVTLNNLSRHW